MKLGVLEVLQTVAQHQAPGIRCTIPFICRQFEASEGAVRRHVCTCEAYGYLMRAGGGGRNPVWYEVTEHGQNLIDEQAAKRAPRPDATWQEGQPPCITT